MVSAASLQFPGPCEMVGESAQGLACAYFTAAAIAIWGLFAAERDWIRIQGLQPQPVLVLQISPSPMHLETSWPVVLQPALLRMFLR